MTPTFVVPYAPTRASRFCRLGTAVCSRRGRAARAANATCVWVKHSATVLIEATTEEMYDSYINLEEMPTWSPWLKSVEVDKVDGDVSRWTIASRGFEFSWKARNTKVVRGEIIAWKSESGLPNRGNVLFESVRDTPSPESNITLAIEFDVPGAVAKALDNNFIGQFVEGTLLADLQRFRKVALANRRRLRSNKVTAAAEAESVQ